MAKILTLALLTFICLPTFAQEAAPNTLGTSTQSPPANDTSNNVIAHQITNPGPSKSVLHAARLDDTFFVLRKDLIVGSKDGVHWQTMTVHPTKIFLGPDAQIVAVTADAFLGTRDGGLTWQSLEIPRDKDTSSLPEVSQSNGEFFAIEGSNIYFADKANHWTLLPSMPCDSPNSIAASDTLMAAFCDADDNTASKNSQTSSSSAIRVSSDSGTTWTDIERPPEDPDGIYVSGKSIFLRAGGKNRDVLYKLDLNGKGIWSKVLSHQNGEWPDPPTVAADGIVVPDDDSLVLVPPGDAPSRVLPLPGGAIRDIAADKTDLACVQLVGDHYKVSFSKNHGKTWVVLPPPPRDLNIQHIALSKGTIIAKPQYGPPYIYSVDSDPVWKPLARTLYGERPSSIGVIGKQLFAVGKNVFSTSDYGQTWKHAQLESPPKAEEPVIPAGLIPPSPIIRTFAFVQSTSADFLLIASDVAHLSSNGLSWTVVLPPTGQQFQRIRSYKGKIYALTTPTISFNVGLTVEQILESKKQETLYTKEKDSKTWTVMPVPEKILKSGILEDLLLDTQESVYLCASNAIYRSQRDGSWKNVAEGILAGRTLKAFYLDANDVLHVGTNTGLFWSNDQGQNWHWAIGDLERNPKSIKEISVVDSTEFIALATDSIFSCINQVRIGTAQFTTVPLDVQIDGEISEVLVDGEQSTQVKIVTDHDHATLRADKDYFSKLYEGVHEVAVKTSKLGQQTSMHLYIYKELQVAKYFRPYNKSYALVVAASGKWDTPEFQELTNAVGQAKQVASVLRDQGFDVKEYYEEDASKSKIEDYLESVDKLMAPDDRFLFYFSGHGYTQVDASDRSIGYLLAYGATKSNIRTKGISVTSIEYDFAANLVTRPKHALFVLDACFSGLPETKEAINASDLRKFLEYKEIGTYTNKRMRAVLSAGLQGEPALDVNGGIFTKAFINGIKGGANIGGDRVITLDRLIDYIRRTVIDEASMHQRTQTPKLSKLSSLGDGVFIFIQQPQSK